MRVAIVQTNPVFGEITRNVEGALSIMDSAVADLYVLPELFNTGYNFVDEREASSLAEPVSGTTFQVIADFSKKKSCCVIYGFAERDVKLYNSAALVGPSGLLGLYRKIHLFDRENLFFARGDRGFPVFDLPFGKMGIMICFDWMYPESARTLALKGAQLVAHPSNLVLPYCPDAMVTRCLENRIFTATANRVGSENRGGFALTYIGKSELVSPRGEILERLSEDREGIAVAEIDLFVPNNKRINLYNDLLADRQPQHYLS